jgi:hypothetical protein
VHGREGGAGLQQFHAEVADRTDAHRAVVPGRTGLARGREESGATRQLGRRHQHQRRRGQQRQQAEVARRVEGQPGVEQRRRREVAIDDDTQRVVVPGLGHLVGCDVAGGAGVVVDHHTEAECTGQDVGQHTRGKVRRGATGETHDQAYGPAGPRGRGRAKQGRQRQPGQTASTCSHAPV